MTFCHFQLPTHWPNCRILLMVVARQLGANDLPEIYSAFKARFIGEAVMVHSFFSIVNMARWRFKIWGDLGFATTFFGWWRVVVNFLNWWYESYGAIGMRRHELFLRYIGGSTTWFRLRQWIPMEMVHSPWRTHQSPWRFDRIKTKSQNPGKLILFSKHPVLISAAIQGTIKKCLVGQGPNILACVSFWWYLPLDFSRNFEEVFQMVRAVPLQRRQWQRHTLVGITFPMINTVRTLWLGHSIILVGQDYLIQWLVKIIWSSTMEWQFFSESGWSKNQWRLLKSKAWESLDYG